MLNIVPLFRKLSDGQMIPGRIVSGIVDLHPVYPVGALVDTFAINGARYYIYENYWQMIQENEGSNGDPASIVNLPAQAGKRYVITNLNMSWNALAGTPSDNSFLRITKTTSGELIFINNFRATGTQSMYVANTNIAIFGDLGDGLTSNMVSEDGTTDCNRSLTMNGIFVTI